MSNSRIAYRYAEALRGAAEELREADEIAGDLTMIRGAVDGSQEFRTFLKSPIVKAEKKKVTFAAVFGTRVRPLTLQFAQLLIEKGREAMLPLVIDCFFRLRDDALGIVPMDVRSAAELTGEQIAEIERRIGTVEQKTVRATVRVEKELIGGFVARVGDTVYDGSVKRQLELLRRRLTEEITVRGL